MEIDILCKIRRVDDGECAVWIEDMFGKVMVYYVGQCDRIRFGRYMPRKR